MTVVTHHGAPPSVNGTRMDLLAAVHSTRARQVPRSSSDAPERRLRSSDMAARPASRLAPPPSPHPPRGDRKSTRLNSSHSSISYAVFCLKKKKKKNIHFFFLTKKKKKNNK